MQLTNYSKATAHSFGGAKQEFSTSMRSIVRRAFLRSAGVALALPNLPSIANDDRNKRRRRMVAINIGLGLHAPNFLPEKAGVDYDPPEYLQLLGEFFFCPPFLCDFTATRHAPQSVQCLQG